MNLLDRFSAHVRDVLARSIHLAAELKNPAVEPVHLLFVLSSQKGSIATEVINRFKVTPQILEQALLNLPTRENSVRGIAAKTTLPLLSLAVKVVVEKALALAHEHSHNYIGTEHLLSAILNSENDIVASVLAAQAVNVVEFKKQLDNILVNAANFPRLTEATEIMESLEENLSDASIPLIETHGKSARGGSGSLQAGGKKETALEFFANHLTDPSAQKNIDPVIGREQEIERVIQIICRRTKNNPLLLGDPGVGKTAVVEGLAKKIVEGNVPDILLNKKIYALDMGMLIAGTIYRGEFESRLRQVIDETVNNPNIILFIDEIHNIVGAGSNQGTLDAANILKPALARGQIRCIGATTHSEYKKYIENDAALERRFQSVYTCEPSLEDTVKILRGIKRNYEAYHNVIITDEAVAAAAKLSARYITNKFLPDKAIDLLDETAAAKKLGAKLAGWQSKLLRLERMLEKIILAKETAAANDDFAEAVLLKKEEEVLRAEITKATEFAQSKKNKTLGTVSARDIALQVARVIGTTPSELMLNDQNDLHLLEERLKVHVLGQDPVIEEVAQLIRQAKLELANPDRPLASFLFVGESGVGKTELAKTLAKVLYSNPDALIKLDMSEFNESFSVSKLLGSPAGYVGYKETNQFTDKIKINPYSVVLFDEIDKAHKDIVKLLLQILENGEITDATGKKISLKHAIIILTTSLGAADLAKGALGFGQNQTSHAELKIRLNDKLKEFFSPEIINRLDRICWFAPLDKTTLVQIAELELKRFNERLKHYETSLATDHKVLEWIVAGLASPHAGAREVRRYVRGEVEALMSKIILKDKVKEKYKLAVQENKLAIK